MQRFFLIRHGQTTQNTGEIYKGSDPILDFKIPLTETGTNQAQTAGRILNEYLKEEGVKNKNTLIYTSSYDRAEATFNHMNESLCYDAQNISRSDFLIEQNFGLFDGVHKDLWPQRWPEHWAYFLKYAEAGGKYYAKYPNGESPADVSMRARSFLGVMFRDIERWDAENIIIVSHGTTLRCLYKEYFNKDARWYANEPTPKNCSIREIIRYRPGYSESKYIFDGYE